MSLKSWLTQALTSLRGDIVLLAVFQLPEFQVPPLIVVLYHRSLLTVHLQSLVKHTAF